MDISQESDGDIHNPNKKPNKLISTPTPTKRFNSSITLISTSILALFSFFFVFFNTNLSFLPNPISISSQCRIISTSVDLRSSKVCELGLLNYKAKNVFYPSQSSKFRCRYDYYWTSVFKVEYREHTSGQTRRALVEAPKEALPFDCRPSFSVAWLTKEKFKVNETYNCQYTPGISRVDIYSDSLFNCNAKDPSIAEMVKRYFILFTGMAYSFYLDEAKSEYFMGALVGMFVGIFTALISFSLVRILQIPKSKQAKNPEAVDLRSAVHHRFEGKQTRSSFKMFASGFSFQSTHKTIVRAADTSVTPYTLPLSNLDLLSGRSPVIVVFVYTKPQAEDFSSVLEIIKTSLSQTLDYYFPFAGRVVSNSTTNDPEILCNNQGVELIEAHANIDLASLDFYDTEKSLKHITIPLSPEIPLCLQVTSFTCGGFSMSWTFDHILVDATAINLFLVTWSQVAQKKQISNFPDHQRLIFKPRSPPTYCPLLDKTFTKCSMEMILNTPMAYDNSIKRLYFIEGSDVSKLQQLASQNGERRTKLEAFSAYLWKVVATALKESDTQCKMGWLVEGRRRMLSKDISKLIGNVLSMAVGEASMEELNDSTVSKVATIAHKAINEVTTEEHFRDLNDWIEHHKPGMFLAKILLGISGPALIVSSSRQFPSMNVELGFGPPLLGTYYTSLPRLGAGFVIPQPSSRGDGSWVVFAIVWPKLAAALESDPNHIFKPITANHLGLE